MSQKQAATGKQLCEMYCHAGKLSRRVNASRCQMETKSDSQRPESPKGVRARDEETRIRSLWP